MHLGTSILDFRGFDSSRTLMLKDWNSHAHREFPGSFEPTNCCRGSLSREIGRGSPATLNKKSAGPQAPTACIVTSIITITTSITMITTTFTITSCIIIITVTISFIIISVGPGHLQHVPRRRLRRRAPQLPLRGVHHRGPAGGAAAVAPQQRMLLK